METEEGYAEKLCAKLFHASMKVLHSICIIFVSQKNFERDMLTFIFCAKTMTARTSVGVPEITVPYFQAEAVQNALDMGQFSAADLERLLRINSKIAAENYLRYQDFFSEANSAMPAICAYTGAVFKRIVPKDFSEDDFRYA